MICRRLAGGRNKGRVLWFETLLSFSKKLYYKVKNIYVYYINNHLQEVLVMKLNFMFLPHSATLSYLCDNYHYYYFISMSV